MRKSLIKDKVDNLTPFIVLTIGIIIGCLIISAISSAFV